MSAPTFIYEQGIKPCEVFIPRWPYGAPQCGCANCQAQAARNLEIIARRNSGMTGVRA